MALHLFNLLLFLISSLFFYLKGILDQIVGEKHPVRVTASLFLPLQGRLACGREDGSIILIPAIEAIMLHLLHGKHQGHNSELNTLILLFYLKVLTDF